MSTPSTGPRPRRPDCGFTLIELLVVIVIIGVLIALLLPAVQAAREAARRMRCMNNLRQIGLALHNYHGDNQALPGGVLGQHPPLEYFENPRNTWPVGLLPYLEQRPLADHYNYQVGFGPPDCQAVNGTAFATRIDTYLCPSDRAGSGTDPYHQTTGTRSNYVGCFSPDWGWVENGAPVNFDGEAGANLRNPTVGFAAFNFNRSRRLDEITDGTSQTVIASELIAGPDGTADLRGQWWHEYGVMYVHHLPPNSPRPDEVESGHCPRYCDASKAPIVGDTPAWKLANFAARSYHPGGVNALRGDGSVRWARDTIDPRVWQALASINSGEVIASGAD